MLFRSRSARTYVRLVSLSLCCCLRDYVWLCVAVLLARFRGLCDEIGGEMPVEREYERGFVSLEYRTDLRFVSFLAARPPRLLSLLLPLLLLLQLSSLPSR